jgi:nucleoid DNA-binding protein
VEKIIVHIENLLCYHEYVVVPGLGGFVLQKQSAQITDNIIVAPRACIAFNALLQHADGLLAIEIARAEGITYRAANELVAGWVTDVNQQLQQNGLVALGSLGQLSNGDGGQYLFYPNETANFLPQNFGLNNIALLQNTQSPIVERHIKLRPSKLLKYSAAAVLLFGMLFVSPQLNEGGRTEYADLLSLSFTELPQLEVQAQACANPLSDTAIVSVNDFENDTVYSVSSPVQTVESPRFHVIVASLPTLSGAEYTCEQLKNDSFSNARIISAGKHNRVAIASFCDRNEAVQYMETLRSENQRFETAWVYCE